MSEDADVADVYDRAVALLAGSSSDGRRTAVSLLQRAARAGHPQALDLLLRLLEDADAAIRQDVAVALPRLRDTRAVAALSRALHDYFVGTRMAAARGLGAIGGAAAADALVQGLAASHPDMGRPVADALARCGPDAIPALARGLRMPYWWVRLAAVEALGALQDPLALEPLLHTLDDTEISVRWTAACALGELGDPRAVEPLGRLLAGRPGSGQDPRQRLLAVAQTLADRPLLGDAETDYDVARACRDALEKISRKMRSGPTELIAAGPPAGRGTELEASAAGRGTELEAAGAETPAREPQPARRPRWRRRPS